MIRILIAIFTTTILMLPIIANASYSDDIVQGKKVTRKELDTYKKKNLINRGVVKPTDAQHISNTANDILAETQKSPAHEL